MTPPRRSTHGTHADYVHGCHCAECTAAEATYRAQLRRRHHAQEVADAMTAASDHWRGRAACADTPIEVFFPDRAPLARSDGQGNDTWAYLDAAAICTACPVQAECLEHALWHGIDDGYWGGRTPNQRRQLRRQRRITPLRLDLDDVLFDHHPHQENPNGTDSAA